MRSSLQQGYPQEGIFALDQTPPPTQYSGINGIKTHNMEYFETPRRSNVIKTLTSYLNTTDAKGVDAKFAHLTQLTVQQCRPRPTSSIIRIYHRLLNNAIGSSNAFLEFSRLSAFI